MGITTQIIGLLACLSFLVITHELGHYAFARIFHTRVDKFYMFFNPYFSIFKCKKFNGKWHFKFFAANQSDYEEQLDAEGKPVLDEKGKKKMVRIDTDKLEDDDWRKYPENTEWGIGWLPLGGYCSINGMVDETTKPGELPAEPQPWEFRSKPAWQRLFIILGGVLVNFITALVLYVVVLFTWGEEYIPVENAKYGMHFSEVALNTGFQNGDRIVTIDGVKPERAGDITGAVLINGAQRVVVERPVDHIRMNEDSTFTVEKTTYEKTTVYLGQDFAKTLIGAEKSEQYFCQFEMPFVLDSVPPESPAATAEHAVENVAQIAESAAETSIFEYFGKIDTVSTAAETAFQSVFAVLVINLTFLRIGKDFVGFIYFFELLFGFFITGISVGMILHRHFFVRFLYLFG